jgi:hypothetical protein
MNRHTLKYWQLASLFVSTVFILGYSIVESSFSTLIFYFLFSLIGYSVMKKFKCDRNYYNIYFIVYGISTIAAILLYYIYINRYGVPYIAGGSDDISYERDALIVSKSLLMYNPDEIGRLVNNIFHNSKGYIYILSLIMRTSEYIGGYNTLIPRLFNNMSLGFVSALVYSISLKVIRNDKYSTNGALIAGLFPIMIFTSIHIFRDTIITLILLVTLKLSTDSQVDRKSTNNIFRIATVALLFVIMYHLRFLNIIALSGIVAVTVISRVGKNTHRNILFTGLVIIIIALYNIPRNFDSEFRILYLAEATIDHYSEGLTLRSEGLSTSLFSLPFPLSIVGRFVYASITPLPFVYTTIEWTLIGLGTIAQFFFFPYIFIGLYDLRKQIQYWPLLIGFLIVFMGYAYGTFTFRHITQVVPFAMILGMYGFKQHRKSRTAIRLILMSVLVGLGTIYLVLKGVV